MSYTWDYLYSPTFTTTVDSTISGLSSRLSGMTVSTSDGVNCNYTIQLGDTTLETKDIDFLHSLQQINPDCAAALAQIINDFKQQDWSTYTWTGNMVKKIQEEKEKEEEDMININFGPCGDRAKISHLGIAVKNLNGEWVSYDKSTDEIVNVDLINFNGNNFVYMMPVALKDVAPGDAIVHNKHIMFVKKVKSDGIVATDVTAGEVKKILPTKSIFGFDFITKLVSLIDITGISASEESPFGNLLPFLLLNEDKKESDALPLAIMMMDGNVSNFSNPLMMYLLMKGESTSNNLLPLVMMMNQKKVN